MSDLFSLDGKIAIVTGASKEMGEAIALLLAEHGADVAVTARTAELLEGVAERIRKLGRRALAFSADLRNSEDRQQIVERTVAEFKQRLRHVPLPSLRCWP